MEDRYNQGIVIIRLDITGTIQTNRFFLFKIVVILVSIDPTRLLSMGGVAHGEIFDFLTRGFN